MSHIRLVIADVDGTLVNDHRELSDYTKKTIERLHEEGILFGVASGRDYVQLLEDNEYWGFDFPFEVTIGMNGGQVYIAETKQLYEYNKLSTDTVKDIVCMMEPLNLNPFVYGPDHTMICKRIDKATEDSGERNSMTLHVVKDISEFWSKPIPKIMYRTTKEQMPEVYQWALQHPSKNYQAFKTQTTMLEFQDPHIHKGIGLQHAVNLLNIDMKDVVAFGDMSNDNPMLLAAGTGVCLKNGAQDTKDCADYITDYTNNEDGLAKFIHKYIFKESEE